MLPLALALAALGLFACVRCIRAGQYDDLETPAVRAILDDEPLPPPTTERPTCSKES